MPRSLEALSLGFRSVFVIVEVDDTVEADLLGFAVTEVDFGAKGSVACAAHSQGIGSSLS